MKILRLTAILIISAVFISTGMLTGCGGKDASLQAVNPSGGQDLQTQADAGQDGSQTAENPSGSSGNAEKGISFKWQEGDGSGSTANNCIDYDKTYPEVERARVSVGGIIVAACTADIFPGYVGKCTFIEDKEYTNTIYYYSNYTAAIAQGVCASLKGTWVSAE